MKKMIFLVYVVIIFMACKEEGGTVIDPPLPLWTDLWACWSNDGEYISYYHTQRSISDSSGIYIIKPDGSERKFIVYGGAGSAWSPNGEWLAVDQLGDGQIYKINTTTRQKVLLTTGSNKKFFPSVSPDGFRIAFSIDDDGLFQDRGIWVVNSDGTNMKLLINTSSSKPTGIQPAWSPLGNEIAFVGWRDTRGSFLMLYDTLTKTTKSIMEHKTRKIGFPKFSPDGKKLIFHLEVGQNGELEIWVINRDGKGLKKIKTCGAYPSWSGDGKKIVYTKYSFENPKKGNGYLWIMNADGSHDTQLTF